MNIRRFEANDTRSALRLVRSELGADAVILSNRSTENGIEVISAVDFDESLLLGLTPATKSGTDNEPAMPNEAVAATDAGSIENLRTEIQSIKTLVEHQLPAQGSETEDFDVATSVRFNQLIKLGFERELAVVLAKQLADSTSLGIGTDALHELLESRIGLASTSLLEDGGIAAFVGPTGVGKTTTIAKLAMQASLRFGAGSVALVSADDQRIGAQEQLERIAALLGIRLYGCQRASELPVLISKLGSTRLVLIDTAGVSQFDPRLESMLRNLRASSDSLNLVLTLAANAQSACLANTLQRYLPAKPDSLVLTKLDECLQLGPALSVLCKHKVALSMLSDGQCIPDDLRDARIALEWLARLTLNREDLQLDADPAIVSCGLQEERVHASI
ncbi:MAG: flagellar biosynthesis protein FlhF [Pseudomonadota bacterium]